MNPTQKDIDATLKSLETWIPSGPKPDHLTQREIDHLPETVGMTQCQISTCVHVVHRSRFQGWIKRLFGR